VARLAPFVSGWIVLALNLFPACGSKPTSNRSTYFPESGQVEGWSKSSATRVFPADRLWEYIDGDADDYVKAGVEQTLTSDYRYRDQIEAAADIFVMKNPTGATRVFESKAANGSQPAPVGDAARLYPGTLMLRKGRFFVRLVAYEESPQAPEALLALARSIVAKLN
jgi:hypothetical protein